MSDIGTKRYAVSGEGGGAGGGGGGGGGGDKCTMAEKQGNSVVK